MVGQVTIRSNAARYDITVHLSSGDQVFKLQHLDKTERDGIRECIINFWCRVNGWKEVY